jgi:chromosome segregation ATPase
VRILLLVILVCAVGIAVLLLALPEEADEVDLGEKIARAERRLRDLRLKIDERRIEEDKCNRIEKEVAEHYQELSYNKSLLEEEYDFYNAEALVAREEEKLGEEIGRMQAEEEEFRTELGRVEKELAVLGEKIETLQGPDKRRAEALRNEKIRLQETLERYILEAQEDLRQATAVLGE